MLGPQSFAHELWSNAELGDLRLTQRAVAALSALAAHPTGSFVEACVGRPAAEERLYRFVRDPKSTIKPLIDAGCRALASRAARDCPGDIAAIQDTTSYGFSHSVSSELGDLGGPKDSKRRGFFSHVTLAVDPATAAVIGPVDLQLGIRPDRTPGKPRGSNKRVPYEEKESFKWEGGAAAADERFGEARKRVIYISDRESDVLEYLLYMQAHDLRYVIRSSWDRRLGDEGHLRPRVWASAERCRVRLRIDQKGGRPARDAVLAVRATTLCIDGRSHSLEELPPLDVNVVSLKEVDPPEGCEPVEWILLTSEPIDSTEAVLRVARLYGLRWLIEEYNKCCKSDGTDIERLRNQTVDNLLRAAVLCMFAAVPLMWLRAELFGTDSRKHGPVRLDLPVPERPASPRLCTQALSAIQWLTLWQATERGSPPPGQPPSCAWALAAVAKLGGWMDSKHTGRPGYPSLWRGWDKLLDRVEAVELALPQQLPSTK